MPSIIIDKTKPELITIELPSYEGSEATIIKRLPVNKGREFSKRYPKAATGDVDQGYEIAIEAATYALRSWNLAEMIDGVETPYEINRANVETLLGNDDVLLISDILQGNATQGTDGKWRRRTEEEKKIQ